MIRAGLTGGLACGKSFVGAEFEKLGCHVIRADEVGHAVLARDGEAYAPVVKGFGAGVLAVDGSIDRRKLARIVFASPERLAALNAIVHPAVFHREEEMISAIAAANAEAIVLVEAAILIETGRYLEYHPLIVVVCSEEQQIERARLRSGSTVDDIRARIGRQMPLAEKRKYADYVIDNSGSREDTIEQVGSVFEQLRRIGE